MQMFDIYYLFIDDVRNAKIISRENYITYYCIGDL